MTLIASLPPAAQAGAVPPAQAQTEQVTARLLAATTAVQPGQTLLVGVQQGIIEHWHTYWVNPGDSGLATTLAWTLPAGASAGPIQWPVPTRIAVGPIVNYGYANEVTLLSSLRVPQGLRDGDVFDVQAKVDWLVCEDTCIPQQVTLGLSLPVRSGVAAASADAARLQQAQARLPSATSLKPQWRVEGQRLQLSLPSADLPAHDAAYFFPRRWGVVAQGETQQLQHDKSGWVLSLGAGESPPKTGDAADGVLVLQEKGRVVQALALGHDPAPVQALAASAARTLPPAPAAAGEASPSLALALLMALAGGLLLNLMPCVFPVLTIKALSLMQQAEASRRTVRLHGLAYAAGVLLSFVVLAAVLIALKAAGDSAGWGFQFQSPAFVLLMALLMLALGLSLSGVATFGGSVTGIGSSLAARGGAGGSFFTGVLATLVATPCTAPFMGAAMGYALTQPAGITLAVFLSLGLGMALPYLLLCEWPALQRLLPRPGAWMERLKQAMAFPMYASAAWLVWVLTRQAGPQALAVALVSSLVLAFALWLYGGTRTLASSRRRHGSAIAAAVLVALAAVAGPVVVGPADAPRAASTTHADWEPYTPQRLADLRAQGKPVFINLTADWCLTCMVNERVALRSESVDQAFRQSGVVRLLGDWTRRDEHITQLLAAHGRSGVPLYLFYPAGADAQPVLLPQLLSPDLILAALRAPRAS
ncbi:protein-disulfide reductase DsbD family protein [Piscinibacter terrae]|nr:thioredoxin family protein [Albitalea terrae]